MTSTPRFDIPPSKYTHVEAVRDESEPAREDGTVRYVVSLYHIDSITRATPVAEREVWGKPHGEIDENGALNDWSIFGSHPTEEAASDLWEREGEGELEIQDKDADKIRAYARRVIARHGPLCALKNASDTGVDAIVEVKGAKTYGDLEATGLRDKATALVREEATRAFEFLGLPVPNLS